MRNYSSGFLTGTGAAQTVELGFVPDYVRVVNLTDADMIFEGPVYEVVAFDTGDSASDVIRAGDVIHAEDNGWLGVVKQVLVHTGAWGGNTAASGWIVFEPGSLVGADNIADDDPIHVAPQKGATGATEFAKVSAAGLVTTTMQLDPTNSTDANKMDPAGANEHIQAYYGTSGADQSGFTLQSSISEDNKLLFYQAWGEGSRADD